MPALWRLYRSAHGPGLDGAGGTFAEGRWHFRGERVVYFGASAAIVVLERLAHIDPDLLPDDLRLAHLELSAAVEEAVLPAGWIEDENATRRIGRRWLREPSACLLRVPSVILPEESNYVFNPEHPDARRLRLIRERPLPFRPTAAVSHHCSIFEGAVEARRRGDYREHTQFISRDLITAWAAHTSLTVEAMYDGDIPH